MSRDKTDGPPDRRRGEPVRQRVLDAAERLLREGKPEFSMRELAAQAAVSFATPFNHFGSKAAIMHALSARRIETMTARLAEARLPADAAARVRHAVGIAAAVMLEEPLVNRVVMGWIGTGGASSGDAMARSAALWACALGDGEGLAEASRGEALRLLPNHLAFAFRGTLSFWTAGELTDAALGEAAQSVAAGLLRAYSDDPHR